MSYRALYRVFRPQCFAEVRGQDHISTTLKNALVSERLSHAYLFCGPRGTGKTSSAKILAKAVNCLNAMDGEPCNQCTNCKSINEESFLDVLEIDAASNRGIDEIRDLRDKVKFAPSQGKRKVYIIDEVHMLTNEAFNALLKTLEEPPSHVLFILATTEPQKIPLTILSRCQRFDFRKINTAEIRDCLSDIVKEEHVSISEAALSAIVRKAAGGMRDAISVLDQCIAFAGDQIEINHVELVLGTVSEEATASLLAAIIDSDYAQIFHLLNEFAQQGKDIKQILRDFIEYCRQLLLLKVAPKEQLVNLSEDMMSIAQKQSQQLSVPLLSSIINRLANTEKDLRYSNQPQILLEAALVDFVLFKQEPEITAAAPSTLLQQGQKISQPENPAPSPKLVASEALLTQWSQVMAQIKNRSVKLHAFLNEAQPAALQDGQLILRFGSAYQFHFNTVSQPDHLRMIEEVLADMTGKPLKVVPQLENANGNIPQELSLTEEAARLFGRDVLEIKN